jgi:hypothetical protein
MRILIALGLTLAGALALLAIPGGGAAAEPDGSAVMTWSRTGGFAGVSHSLRVGTGRRAVAVRDGQRFEKRLSPTRYERLRALLDEARLETLKPRYPAPGAADTFQYAVGYRGHTVSADETKVPARLKPALAALSKVFDDVAAGQAFRAPENDALADARARWRAANLRSYRFRLRVACFCPGAGRHRVIRVRDGRPHGGNGAQTAVDTVPEMFRQIAEALRSSEAGEVSVRYDQALGYPRRASIDHIEAAMDDEISWTADRLRPPAR